MQVLDEDSGGIAHAVLGGIGEEIALADDMAVRSLLDSFDQSHRQLKTMRIGLLNNKKSCQPGLVPKRYYTGGCEVNVLSFGAVLVFIL